MKATFTINQLQFEMQAEDAMDLFRQVANIQDVFEAETKCGCCQSQNIRYGFREVDAFKYYDLGCRDCGAQFKFGQRKQGGLFPKRKDDQGKPLANGGWAKWEARDEHDSKPAPQQAARPAKGTPGTIMAYPDWDSAERDPRFGRIPLRVDGVLYHVPPGQRAYVESPQRAQ